MDPGVTAHLLNRPCDHGAPDSSEAWPSRSPRAATVRATLLLAFTLVVPIIIAANPMDSLSLAGWYDEADADQLITNTMSPGTLLALLTLPSLLLFAAVVTWSVLRHGRNGYNRMVARGPPSWPSRQRALTPPAPPILVHRPSESSIIMLADVP